MNKIIAVLVLLCASGVSSSNRELQTLPNPFLDGTDPVWYNAYRVKYGKRVKKCVDQPFVPVNGTVCPRKKIGAFFLCVDFVEIVHDTLTLNI